MVVFRDLKSLFTTSFMHAIKLYRAFSQTRLKQEIYAKSGVKNERNEV